MKDHQRTASELYVAGREAMKVGDRDVAKELICAALEESPQNAGWRAVLGQLLLDQGHIDEAIRELQAAESDNPNLPRLQVLLGRALQAAGSDKEAGAAFERAVELDVESVAAWAALGQFAKSTGNAEQARHAYSKVVALDENRISAHAELAALAGERGDTETECHHRGVIADARPEHVPSQMLHGAVLIKVGRLREAQARFIHVAEIRPDHPGASAVAEELGRWIVEGQPEDRVVSVAYYDAVYSKDNHYREDGSELEAATHFALICDLLAEEAVESVLDIGCGPGQFAQYLRSRSDVPYTGIDYSPIAIELARERQVAGAVFQVLDITADDLPSTTSTTAIVCTEVLEHVRDDIALISKIPVGRTCYFSVPNFDTFGHVRHFDDEGGVRDRYAAYFDDFAVSTIPIGSGSNRLFVFKGVRKAA